MWKIIGPIILLMGLCMLLLGVLANSCTEQNRTSLRNMRYYEIHTTEHKTNFVSTCKFCGAEKDLRDEINGKKSPYLK